MSGVTSIRPLREHAFLWALTASIMLHALLGLTANPFSFAKEPLRLPIEVELLPPPKPEPPPEPIKPPEPPKPEPPPPPQPKPRAKPPTPVEPPPVTPPPVEQPVAPAPEPPPAPAVAPEPPPPPVIAAAPKVEEPPVFTAPPPPPPPPEPPKPSAQEISSARENYGSVLARAFAKHKQYPRLAQMRGWQGVAKVRLEVDAAGSMISSVISESSGHDILDRQALEMVKKAMPLPQPPDVLRGEPFTIIVPIVFRLE